MTNPDNRHDGAEVLPFPRPPMPVERTDQADPAPGAEVEPAGPVLEAEIVSEEEYARRRRLPVVRPAGTVVRLVRSPQAAGAVRVTVRAGVTIAAGFGSWAHRGWDVATHGVHRRTIRAAEAAGDREALAAWVDRLEQARESRHHRMMDAPRLALQFGLVGGIGLVATPVLLCLLGLVLQLTGAGTFLGLWHGVFGAVRWSVAVVPVVVKALLVLGLPVVLAAAFREGRRRGSLPGWALAPAQREQETAIITPLGVAEALEHLGISKIAQERRQGWQVEFHTPPTRINNRGYHTVFSLPRGVTPAMIADKRDVLARNLNRAPLEVWPAAAERPGYLEVWVADSGATEKPAPEYPLLHTGSADVFAGIPAGVSQRGDVIAPPLVAKNLVFGGQMGMGKSNAARVVVLGAALDPLAELWVFVFAHNGDFDAYRPRLSRYHKGVDDAVCAAALAALNELYTEVGRREQRLAELGAKKVTRGLAEKHPDLRPIIVLFSECHELFGHEELGKAAADVATQTLRRARKTAITLMFDTQSSRADAIPPKIVELVAINVCFYVKAWRSNDGFLGDGSFQAGIRATELRPEKDRGTAVVTGSTPERFEILKWFYIEVDDDTGYDAATEVIARAVAALHPAVPALGDRPTPAAEPVNRDLLEDLDEVLGVDPVPVAEAAVLLRNLAPGWAPYRGLTGVELRTQLGELGVKVPATGNRYPVDPVTVRQALARRATADLDEGSE